MTMHYTRSEEQYLRDKAASQAALAPGIELFMCSDGNYRDADAKARFDELRKKITFPYSG